jgi:transcriptional regulator with XRE-family HTH domain
MLAENIKRYRKKLGLTQETLSRKANTSYNTIIKIEAGSIKDPRMNTLKKLAGALEISIDKLIKK